MNLTQHLYQSGAFTQIGECTPSKRESKLTLRLTSRRRRKVRAPRMNKHHQRRAA